MLEKILNQAKPKMAELLRKFEEEIKQIRAGGNPVGLVENIIVSYYGNQTPLKNMASISAPQPNFIRIQPWDTNALGDIETALRNSEMSFNPSNDGRVISISLPPMTEEKRQDYIKILHRQAEEIRIGLRNIREDAWKDIQTAEKNKELTEDDRYRGEAELNKIIKEMDDKIAANSSAKEKELGAI